jgi:predicted dehydrogenase
MKNIKWGIIGAGSIAAKFASDLKTVPNCEVIAIGSTSLERAQAFAKTWNIPHSYGTYEGMFELGLDAVYVASWHPAHKEHTLLCLNHGVAILCEKPFGLNASEVEVMLQTAQDKKIFLMEALWSRFHPTLIKAKELLDTQAIGTPVSFQCDFGFKAIFDPNGRHFNPSKGGGALLDIGIYPAFFAYHLFGFPDEISAMSIPSPTGTDDTTSFMFKYENNLIASLSCSLSANTQCEAVIYGELGKILIHRKFHEAKKVSIELYDGSVEVFVYERGTFGYDYEIAHVNECLREGKTESAMMSHQNSRDLIKLLDSIAEKAGIVY